MRPKGLKHTKKTIRKIKWSCIKNAYNTRKIGSKRIEDNNYIRIKIGRNNWVAEHRYKVERYIGYHLLKQWIVHHIDNNPRNNRLSNLYIFRFAGLHSMFEILIKYGVIKKNILKSNLKEFKK